jgi:hypothetical protein
MKDGGAGVLSGLVVGSWASVFALFPVIPLKKSESERFVDDDVGSCDVGTAGGVVTVVFCHI